MMRPRSLDSDTDEPSEDALLEAEHARMQRSYRVMQNDYRAYREETKRLINKQRTLTTSLEAEGVEIDTQLAKMETTQNRDMDAANMQTLTNLACEEKEHQQMIKEETNNVKELNEKIKAMEKKISEQRQKMGGIHNGTTNTIATHKKKAVLENRLDKAMVHFNKQLAINRRLREDIDHLRRERAVFENLYKKLSKELNNCKNEMREVIEASTQAFEQRDEAQNKMAALRERNDKDQQQHNTEVKDLLRVISHDDKVKEFMNIKNSDRADYISEEMAKRSRNGTDDDKGVNAEIETIRVYEEAFNKIKAVTGEENIETIVEDFIKNEDENFALFNYVNELNSEVETLQEEVALIKKDIQAYKREDTEADDKRHKLMRQLEKKYDKTVKETSNAEERLRQANKVLEELRKGIEMMFKRIGCDPKPIREMLGGEYGVTNKNIMIYLGRIEQRTTELLNILHYTKMKKAEIEGQAANKADQDVQKQMPDNLNIQIPVPNTWEDRDSEDEDHDDEPRPYSESELRERVLRSLTRRAFHPQKMSTEKKPDTPNKDKKKGIKVKPIIKIATI